MMASLRCRLEGPGVKAARERSGFYGRSAALAVYRGMCAALSQLARSEARIKESLYHDLEISETYKDGNISRSTI